MNQIKKYYFVSDAHLGVPDYESSLLREKKLVSWLETIRPTAEGVFFMGDIFDFWFEYKDVVPKYFIRLLGKITELTDQGIPIWFFKGNHDMWTFGYLEKELRITIINKSLELCLMGKKFFLAHGDGLGPRDHGYKFIKTVFKNPLSRKLFSMLHPRIGFKLAKLSSERSRIAHSENDKNYYGPDSEVLIQFAKKKLNEKHFDYFIFGHRHLALIHDLNDVAQFINLGDWITHFTYGEFDGTDFILKKFEN